MKNHKLAIALILTISVASYAIDSSHSIRQPTQNTKSYPIRADTIENFDDGMIELFSYPGEDYDSSAWALDSLITYNNSPYSLKLWGNTWKLESIIPVTLDTGDIWQVAAYVDTIGEIHGFGLRDTAHTLLYSFAGTQQLNIENWVTVYQGAFPNQNWNLYQLPVGQDWLAYYGYLPTVNGIVFINDRDYDPNGVVYFDDVLNITNDLPMVPQVTIWFTSGQIYEDTKSTRLVDVQFYSTVVDTDSWYHEYFWYFGDDSTSSEPNPFHTYIVEDDHEYTVLLEVVDSTYLWGRTTCHITVDPGPSTFPLTMNFVGDVMLARRYEQPGGIIPTLGVEAIFEPTLPFVGDAAEITVANLECPLTDTGAPHPTKPIIFRGSPENVDGLAYAGVDVVTIANNHIIDYGLEGLQETQSVLDSNNIRYSGAGANAYEAYLPLFYNKKGVNIAFLASSDRTGQYDNYQPYLNAGFNKPGFANLTQFDISRQIQTVENDADLIIVEMHSGNEYSPTPVLPDRNPADYNEDEMYSPFLFVPTRDDIEDRHHAIDEGADLVVCHHVHVLQGLEVYNGKLIAHSLGDFTFDLNYTETFPSMILNAKINETGFYEYCIVPVYIDDYIPMRAKGELGLYILDYLVRRTKDLNTYLVVDRDSITAQLILDTLNMTSTTTTSTDEVQLHYEDNYWISNPQRLTRYGDIWSMLSIIPSGNWQFRLGRETIWFGNFEDEGCTLWEIDHDDEFYDSTVAFRGARSLCQRRIEGSSTITTGFENRITCNSDTTHYTLYGHIKTQNANNARAVVRFYESRYGSYSLGSRTIGEIDDTTDWTSYHDNFVPANGTNYFDIWLRSDGPQSGEAHVWFDDIGVIEWEDWQAFNPAITFPTPNDYYWIQIRTDVETYDATVSYEEMIYNPGTVVDYSMKNDFPYVLFQSFPNPATSSVTIRYQLSATSGVTLQMYNVLGQQVRTLVNKTQTPGLKSAIWDGRDNQGRKLGAGVYFCRLQTAGFKQSQKIVWLK